MSRRSWLEALLSPQPAPQPTVVRHPRPTAGSKVVRPSTVPLLQQRGWAKRGNTWHGHYVHRRFGTWPGRIEVRGNTIRPYIQNPPPEVRRHNKWQCFHDQGGGWFWVHLHDRPCDGDCNAVAAYIERLLAEALASRGR